jgi:hypothetical protein
LLVFGSSDCAIAVEKGINSNTISGTLSNMYKKFMHDLLDMLVMKSSFIIVNMLFPNYVFIFRVVQYNFTAFG